MRAVGVNELKARLSEYLLAVRAGETVLITDRAEVIAELRPPGQRATGFLHVTLDALAQRGDITRARVAKGDWHWKPKGLGLSARAVRDIRNGLRVDH